MVTFRKRSFIETQWSQNGDIKKQIIKSKNKQNKSCSRSISQWKIMAGNIIFTLSIYLKNG